MALARTTWYRFGTTRWSLMDRVRGRREAGEAMGTLTRIYYPAVYAYLRRSGVDAESADEVAQGFFADVVVGRRLFEQMNCGKGRARDYLLGALSNYVRDRHRREVARGKGRRVPEDAVNREEANFGSRREDDAEAIFDRRLATATLKEALGRCEHYYLERGMKSHWAVFEARELIPALFGANARPLSQLAEELGFRTPADAAAAVQTVKRRAAVLVREVLVETSPPGADVDAEHRWFLAALAGS